MAVATAEAAVAQQRLEQAKVALQQLELRAPEDGVIVGVTARQGGRLEAGAPALTLLPARPLIVRAELNSAYVASVRVGMRATVASDMDSEAAAPLCLRPSWCASAPSTATAACRTTPSAVLCAWSSASWNSTARQRRSSAKT